MKTKRTALTQFRYETQIIEKRNIDLHGLFDFSLLLAVHRDYSYLDQHIFAHYGHVLPFHDNVSQWAMGPWNQRPRRPKPISRTGNRYKRWGIEKSRTPTSKVAWETRDAFVSSKILTTLGNGHIPLLSADNDLLVGHKRPHLDYT